MGCWNWFVDYGRIPGTTLLFSVFRLTCESKWIGIKSVGNLLLVAYVKGIWLNKTKFSMLLLLKEFLLGGVHCAIFQIIRMGSFSSHFPMTQYIFDQIMYIQGILPTYIQASAWGHSSEKPLSSFFVLCLKHSKCPSQIWLFKISLTSSHNCRKSAKLSLLKLWSNTSKWKCTLKAKNTCACYTTVVISKLWTRLPFNVKGGIAQSREYVVGIK